MVAAVVVVLIRPPTLQAKTFVCRGSDVQCLIAAILEANASKKKHAIQLEAGTYTLVDIENTTDGANGLPSITGNLTIQGAGADLTTIERNSNAPCFRLLHVAATDVLTLDGVTISNGLSAEGGPVCSITGAHSRSPRRHSRAIVTSILVVASEDP